MRPHDQLQEGMSTPDGTIQIIKNIIPGVFWIDTGSHAFLVLPYSLAHQLLSPQACTIGEKQGQWLYFEEDCAVAAPFFEHPEWQSPCGFAPGSYDAERVLRQDFPKYFKIPQQLQLPFT